MTTNVTPLSLPDMDIDVYRIAEAEQVLTPALAIYPDLVDTNIQTTLRLLGGNPGRWRPHVKTTKLSAIMRQLVAHDITHFKCSTTLELATVCEAGASDVLIAYPMVGAGARRVRAVAERFPAIRVSALVEAREQIDAWRDSRVGLFIDVNPGMDRTGIQQSRVDEIIALGRTIAEAGLEFRGLHYYDGHLAKLELTERERVAHHGYDRLLEIVAAMSQAQLHIEEIITAGTPAFPCTMSYAPFNDAPFIHRASPGTVVYGDCTSLAQLPTSYGYRPAALVISTVVSRPAPARITCDAGHKTVSADAGVPTCRVLGRDDLLPAKPSEEHLPIDVAAGAQIPALGETLYLVPMHVCPTVNNFDHALLVRDGKITSVERVTARGREAPLEMSSAQR